MNIKLLATIFLLGLTTSLVAQNIVTIAGEEIPTKDFVAMYNKNNINEEDKMPVEEYLQLYINFKLKVNEAEAMGLDKDPSFISELNGYRDQLAKPYLIDEETNIRLIEEAYNNMKYDIRASHILIEVPKYASGKDTVDAWNKIMDLRQRALDGEDFNELAFKYSEDPSARAREYQGRKFPANKGDLGYFTAFNMIYPFEHVAYQTEVGDISMPVRTDYGYHIIYVTDKQPAMGWCKVAHIILKYPKDATSSDTLKTMEYAVTIYDSIMAGMSFEEAAKKYSEDETSSSKGGALIPFTCNQLEANFIEAITKLDTVGQISQPINSIYGCHIIKLIDKSGIKPFKEEEENIKRKINQSDRVQVEIQALSNRLKKEYNFVQYVENMEEVIPMFIDNFDNLDSITFENDKVVFSFENNEVKQSDLISYIDANKKRDMKKAASTVRSQYENLINERLLDYEKDNLSKKHDEFRILLQEYHDGILLFNINEKEIWNKAMEDTVGLKEYYDIHKDNYVWQDRVKATVFKVIDPTAMKEAVKLSKKGVDDKEIVRIINKDSKSYRITMETGYYEPEDNAVVDALPKRKVGISKPIVVDDIEYFVHVYDLIPAGYKDFEECKGHVISDYQNYLDSVWVENLRQKYTVEINKDEVEKLKK